MIFLLNVCCFEKALSSYCCKILSTVHEILKAHFFSNNFFIFYL